jgi:hypothetical protein
MPVWTTDHVPLHSDHMPWRGHWPAQAIPEALAEARSLLAPQAVYEIVPVLKRLPQGLLLPDSALLHSPLLAEALGQASHLALAVCTIGPHLEARGLALGQEGQMARAFTLDALGNTALVEVSRQLQQHIAAAVAPQVLGCEHSPGQDNWPIEDQAAFFALLHPERIGVHLSEHYLMSPLKSLSWAIAIGREDELAKQSSACERCPRRGTCPYAETDSPV